ncbi:MAG: glycosyltransferase [Prevotella sp.]|jgi:glycosyltransferase involved in cell wall biosynthesis|nr:glycosyltransferase [Prevotella sp.]
MSDRIRISIVIPCFNGAKWLSETVQSIFSQTFKQWECIIVNDGSIDNSFSLIKKYSEADNRIKYIDKKNEGIAIARNEAISMSQGEYILALDADDIIAPTYIEKAIEHFDKHPNTKIVYCQADFFGSVNKHWELPAYKYCEFIYNNCIFCSAIYRREDYNRTRGYNSNMKAIFEDWDFFLSMLNENDEVYCIPETLFFYRQHENSRTDMSPETVAEARLQIILNHPEIYSKDIKKTAQWIGNTEQVVRLSRKKEKYHNLFVIFLVLGILLTCIVFVVCVFFIDKHQLHLATHTEILLQNH